MNRSRGQALAVVGIALVIVIGVYLILAPPATPTDTSSNGSGPEGMLGMHDWLDKLGYPVERVNGTFSLPSGGLLISVGPQRPYSLEDVQALESFVQGGGTVLLGRDTVDAYSDVKLFQALGIAPIPVTSSTGTVEGLTSPLGFQPVPVTDALTLQTSDRSSPLLRDGSNTLALTYRYGSGRVIVVGSDYPFRNAGLRLGGSAPFVLALVEQAGGGPVLFDDYHAYAAPPGLGGPDITDVLSPSRPLGLAVILGGGGLLLGLVTRGRRLGKPVPIGAAAVPTISAYLDSMAHLFRRSRRRGGVATHYVRELKRRVGRATGAPASAGDADFLEAVGRFDPSLGERTAQVLANARRLEAGSPTDAALIQLAADVADLEASGPLAQWRP